MALSDEATQSSKRRRTKIVTTIGPATREPETMRALIDAGADVFRLNFSHGTPDDHAELIASARRVAKDAGREVGLLGDLPGPKLRIEDVEGGIVTLHQNSEVELTTEPAPGDDHLIPVGWEGLPDAVEPGQEIFLADGRIRLRVLSTTETSVLCRVEAGGSVSSHQGMNLPQMLTPLEHASQEDEAWIDFAIEQDVDLLAVSFVRSAEDLVSIRARLDEQGSSMPLVPKIEKPQAAENAEEIVGAVLGGVMIARGDLGIELPLERVPVVQKRVIGVAGRLSRPVITATQMLASMVNEPRPTRAEVSDVASAIYQGTDAVMLSEETAIGRYPVQAVEVMDAIARETETDLPHGDWLFNRAQSDQHDVAGSVARAAVGSTYTLGLEAIVVPTSSGRTARLVSAHRPKVPVLAVTPSPSTARRLRLLWGVEVVVTEDWTSLRALLDDCALLARKQGIARSGALIAITAGLPEQELGTNLFEVHRVP